MASTQGVAVLGSTGSVGKSTLDVIAALPDRFHAVGLAANSDVATLQDQINRHRPQFAVLSNADASSITGARMIDSADPLVDLATLDEVDIVVVATTGHSAIPATIQALEAGKIVALANKETIVAAGSIVMPIARRHPSRLRPVDSEHSAIWQCLPPAGASYRDVSRILLTASGGPFRGYSPADLDSVGVEQALAHPTWDMGTRITIDSATLMNKGFELIETAWLFDCPIDHIDILLHPQSIVHSMVEYEDGTVLAQLASHDMRLPIQYALTFPERPRGPAERLTLADIARLEFEAPDFSTFRAPVLARRAFEAGGTYPAVLSRADEVAVQAFLDRKIGFPAIIDIVERALDAHRPESGCMTLDSIVEADKWTDRYIRDILNRMET
ncbi:MAG: 1-deoxy-D-xylulose-5-phosphate reductoisomerase [Thermomicrobiales bacterium]